MVDLLPTNESAAPRAIQQKLDELRLSGCNQTLSWSKLGCIAHTTPDGTGVGTRHVMCNPKDGEWILTEGFPVAQVSRIHENQQIVHVSWNTSGTELAIIDVLGRVSFFAVYMSVNVLQCTWGIVREPENDLSGLVGFWWLNTDKQYAVYRPAAKDEKGFNYPAIQQRNLLPYHPNNKTACLGLTKGGVLKLYYLGDQGRYLEVPQELERFVSTGNLFSHAAFSSDKDGSIILAAYTLSGVLRLYRINITWELGSHQPGAPQPPPPINAILTVKRFKIEALPRPLDHPTIDMSKAFLTNLEVIPPTFSGPGRGQFFPTTVMAVYSVMNVGGPSSVVVRWILREMPASLHPSFDQLGVRRNSISTPATKEIDLVRASEDLIIDKVIIGVTHAPYALDIKFSCIDGSVESRDRNSLKNYPKPHDRPSGDIVFNMTHAGFEFPVASPPEICTGLSLSSNGTVLVKSLSTGITKMAVMEYADGPLDPHENPVGYTSALVALAQVHASGCNNMVNNDDVLMVIRPIHSESLNKALITEVHRALGLKMDFTSEAPNERLFRNPVLQRSLSLQTSIFYEGEDKPMTLAAKLAWIFLHLRIASLGFGTTINTLQRGEELKIESIQPLIGISRWSMDLIAYLVDDLFQLARAVGDRVGDREYIRSIALRTNSPAIFALLSSGTRVLTRYNSRGLRQTETTAATHIHSAQQGTSSLDPTQLSVLRSLKGIFDSSPVKLAHFEKIINDVNGTVTAAYHTLTELERTTCERDIFIHNEIPVVLGNAVERLLRNAQALIKGDIDIAGLYFHDLSWLGLDDDVKSIQSRKSKRIDAIRKTEIEMGKPLRQCTRCCSVTEDFTNSRQTSNWLVSMQRMCFCGSLWMVVKK
ncbi:mediator complex, subunit Med16 [Peziza echinospora]|nr:mediator complex, subunit Med16 [Peziza echinospora]